MKVDFSSPLHPQITACGCYLQIIVDKASQSWTLYDAGPRHVRSPLVCLPPVCGTADVFFRQLLDLTAVGYRVISVRMAHRVSQLDHHANI